jgi:acetyl-CoA carboxylase carboxyl transferase subunit alpha
MAAALKITSEDALTTGLIDQIIPEPLGGAHRNVEVTSKALKTALIKNINELEKLTVPKLLDKRYKKFRGMGVYREVEPEITADE